MTSETLDNPEDSSRLRQADFRCAVVLLLLLIGIFVETLTFPMTGDFGGVDSQWYVSPALFPLIIIAVLFVGTAILLHASLKARGYREITQLKTWIGDWHQQINVDRWYVILVLIGYVYFLIPSTDFYLATVVFMLSLCAVYYLDAPRLKAFFMGVLALDIFIALMLRAVFLDDFYFFSLYAVSDEPLIAWTDSVVTLSIAVSLVMVFLETRQNPQKRWPIAITALVVPLILVIVFNFLLYVPMPVEYGSVMQVLEFVAYDLLGVG